MIWSKSAVAAHSTTWSLATSLRLWNPFPITKPRPSFCRKNVVVMMSNDNTHFLNSVSSLFMLPMRACTTVRGPNSCTKTNKAATEPSGPIMVVGAPKPNGAANAQYAL